MFYRVLHLLIYVGFFVQFEDIVTQKSFHLLGKSLLLLKLHFIGNTLQKFEHYFSIQLNFLDSMFQTSIQFHFKYVQKISHKLIE